MRRRRRHVARALLGDGLQRYGIDILVKTCDKLAAIDIEAHLAADFALDDLRGVLDAERGQDLEKKVGRQGVLSGVVGEEVERGLLVLFERGVLVLEKGLVYTQHEEADVGHGLGLGAEFELFVCLIDLGPDLLACSTDALFADFTNRTASVSVRCRIAVANLGELDQDKLS